MELLQAVVMEQLYLPLPSYNTIQTAGFLWLLTFNSLGTHLEMSNCRQIVFECLRSCLPCCPLQSKCMGFRVHNQMAVNELQIWWEHCVAMRSFQPFPTPSSKFVTPLTLIAFNCNFKKCFCWLFHYIYSLVNPNTCLNLASHCKKRCLFSMWNIYIYIQQHPTFRKGNSSSTVPFHDRHTRCTSVPVKQMRPRAALKLPRGWRFHFFPQARKKNSSKMIKMMTESTPAIM